MPILVVVALATQVLRLINNVLEGVPVELRRAQAFIWFDVTARLLPTKYRSQMQEALSSLQERSQPEPDNTSS